jgi:hypothetical protein
MSNSNSPIVLFLTKPFSNTFIMILPSSAAFYSTFLGSKKRCSLQFTCSTPPILVLVDEYFFNPRHDISIMGSTVESYGTFKSFVFSINT